MSDRQDDRSGGRRRRGPLGSDEEQSDTRNAPRYDSEDDATQQIPTDDATQRIPTDDATQRIPADDANRQSSAGGRAGYRGRDRSSDTQEFEAAAKKAPTETSVRDRESRSKARPARTTGGSAGRQRPAAASGDHGEYSTGYSEVLREREEYLRDIYGGVDWLASFAGFIFTLLFSALLGAGAALLLLAPLGLQESLASGRLTSNTITGFTVVAAVAFFSFLFGGYLSGRMARYDGGRNGAMVLLWLILVAALLLVLSGVLGQVISGTITGNLVGEILNFGTTTTEQLRALGVSGAVLAGGVALAALLGGMLGGRMGSRYHREIDYTP